MEQHGVGGGSGNGPGDVDGRARRYVIFIRVRAVAARIDNSSNV